MSALKGQSCAANLAAYLSRSHSPAVQHSNVFTSLIGACHIRGKPCHFDGSSPSAEKQRQAAIDDAKVSDERWSNGSQLSLVDGMVVAVKDNFCARMVDPDGQPWSTTAGSKMLENFASPYDATVVERLKEGGAVMIGKTNMDEFGMGSYGVNSYFGVTTLNDGSQVAGGSSSGSAAAVALDCCDAAIGSDTGGSVRLPASFCNIVGFKPSYGRVSRYGLISYASSLDTPGILARSVNDVARVFDTIAGPDDRDSTCRTDPWVPPTQEMVAASETGDLSGVKIGIPVEFHVKELPQATLDDWRRSAAWLEDAGAQIIPVNVPSVKDALPVYYVLACAEAASNLARYDGIQFGHRTQEPVDDLHSEYAFSRSEGFGAEVKRRILMGSFVLSSEAYDDYYIRATRIRAKLALDFSQAFTQVDVMLTPVSPHPAPSPELALEQEPVTSYLTDVMTVPASLAGLPALSLPLGNSGQNIQLIGANGGDAKFLGISRRVEHALAGKR